VPCRDVRGDGIRSLSVEVRRRSAGVDAKADKSRADGRQKPRKAYVARKFGFYRLLAGGTRAANARERQALRID